MSKLKYISRIQSIGYGLIIMTIFSGCNGTITDSKNQDSAQILKNNNQTDKKSVWRTCENDATPGPISDLSALPVVEINPYPEFATPRIKNVEEIKDATIAYGDRVTDAEKYPFMAQLIIKMTDGIGVLNSNCGGTIISDRWVLTAAHCVDVQYAEDAWYRARPSNPKPSFDLLKVEVGVGGTTKSALARFDASNALCHVDYNRTGDLENDIALVRLDEPLGFSNMVTAGAIVAQGEDGIGAGLPNLIATPIGYGRTESGVGSPELLEITLNVEQSLVDETTITTKPIDIRGSVCNGDSGGPLVLERPTGALEIIGVTSYILTPVSGQCHFDGIPSTFSRISAYRNEIDSAVLDCLDNDLCFE